MSTLKYREQKRERIQKEIVSLEKTLSLKHTLYFTLIFILISVPVEILIDKLIEKKSFAEALQNLDYTKIITRSIFWFCIHYFWMAKVNKKEVVRKRKELKELEGSIHQETGTPMG
jgi:hypothetical protein